MLVALHSAPKGFFKSDPPHSSDDLLNLVETAARLGFKCFQIGPTTSFSDLDGDRLRTLLDRLGIQRSVHVGGTYDAERFATSEAEFERARNDLHRGVELSIQVSSALVSFHPPFFKSGGLSDRTTVSRSKRRLLKLIEQEGSFPRRNGIKLALESFCYPPFIFTGLRDFTQFVSLFPLSELGVLLEAGHLYQARFNLDEAVRAFGARILDVHVHDATLDRDYKRATHLPLGAGNIDFVNLVRSLRRVKYDGWLTLEIRGSESEIVAGRELLEKLIATQ